MAHVDLERRVAEVATKLTRANEGRALEETANAEERNDREEEVSHEFQSVV